MVSLKPSEIAIPPMPRPATSAETSMLKHTESIIAMPSIQTKTRAKLIYMVIEGIGVLPLRKIARMTFETITASKNVSARIITAVITAIIHGFSI